MDALFAEATSSRRECDMLPTEDVDTLQAVHERLAAKLAEGVDARIREAVAAKLREVELLDFAGGDVTEDAGLSLLCVMVGPRDRGLRQHYRQLGVQPVVQRLRRRLAPFTVYHTYNPYTNRNSVRVCW